MITVQECDATDGEKSVDAGYKRKKGKTKSINVKEVSGCFK